MSYDTYTAKLAKLTEEFVEPTKLWGQDITREHLKDFVTKCAALMDAYQQSDHTDN